MLHRTEIYTIDEIAKIAIGIINSNIEIKYNKKKCQMDNIEKMSPILN